MILRQRRQARPGDERLQRPPRVLRVASSTPSALDIRTSPRCATWTWRCSSEARRDLRPDDYRRARHVIEENPRPASMSAALAAGDLAAAGRTMGESHASLRDLYEVSTPELDALADRCGVCSRLLWRAAHRRRFWRVRRRACRCDRSRSTDRRCRPRSTSSESGREVAAIVTRAIGGRARDSASRASSSAQLS